MINPPIFVLSSTVLYLAAFKAPTKKIKASLNLNIIFISSQNNIFPLKNKNNLSKIYAYSNILRA